MEIKKEKSISVKPCHSKQTAVRSLKFTFVSALLSSCLQSILDCFFCLSYYSIFCVCSVCHTVELNLLPFTYLCISCPFLLICFSGDTVMPDKDITCDLFRFLQLLCEGHNSGYIPTTYTYL